MFMWVLGAHLDCCKNSFPTVSTANNLNGKGTFEGVFGCRKCVWENLPCLQVWQYIVRNMDCIQCRSMRVILCLAFNPVCAPGFSSRLTARDAGGRDLLGSKLVKRCLWFF